MAKIIVQKNDFSWLSTNGYIGLEQVGILWDQLYQKCPAVDSQANHSAQAEKVQVEVPPVSGFVLGETTYANDICIAYSKKNGFKIASALHEKIQKRKLTSALAYNENDEFDPKAIENVVANSSTLLVLLTAEALRQIEVVYAMMVAKFYYQHSSCVILVHDAESCLFPGYDEQPPAAKEFFSEKAVTLLHCYIDTGVGEIVTKVKSEKLVLENILQNFQQNPYDALNHFLNKQDDRKSFAVSELRKRMKPFMTTEELDKFEVAIDQNKDGEIDSNELKQVLEDIKQKASKTAAHEATEDIRTRVFLSHKRSTGQGIAGRLYEGLKESYKVFIDSEAKFKIHNLKMIVENTDVFVFILTYGILLSKWCLEELKAAIAYKKKIVIVRELSCNLPQTLPPEWQPVESVIRSSEELIWIAEYNSACIQSLKQRIGPADEALKPSTDFLESEDGKKIVAKVIADIEATGTLELPKLPLSLDALFWANPKIAMESVVKINLAGNRYTNDETAAYIAQYLPQVIELDLSHCNLTDKGIESLSQKCTEIRKLNLAGCFKITDKSLEHISKFQQLTWLSVADCRILSDEGTVFLNTLYLSFLDLSNCSNMTLRTLQNIRNQSNLQHLKINGWVMTRDMMSELQSLYNVTQLELAHCEQLADGVVELMPRNITHLNMSYCTRLSEKVFNALYQSGAWIQKLDISNCISFLPKAFTQYLPNDISFVSELDLSNNSKLDDSALQQMGRFSKLKKLWLRRLGKLTDAGIANLFNLTHLSVQDCFLLTSDCIGVLAKNCPDLEELNIAGCQRMDEKVFAELEKSFPNLKKLVLSFYQTNHTAAFANALSAYRTSHPQVQVEQVADSLIDVLDTINKWYPATIYNSTPEYCTIHYYGWPTRYNEDIKWNSGRLAPIRAHADNYGNLGPLHTRDVCSFCPKLHDFCEHIIFEGKGNPFFA